MATSVVVPAHSRTVCREPIVILLNELTALGLNPKVIARAIGITPAYYKMLTQGRATLNDFGRSLLHLLKTSEPARELARQGYSIKCLLGVREIDCKTPFRWNEAIRRLRTRLGPSQPRLARGLKNFCAHWPLRIKPIRQAVISQLEHDRRTPVLEELILLRAFAKSRGSDFPY